MEDPFRKEIAGRNHNAYHWMHCANLKAMLEFTGDTRMVQWLAHWIEYTAIWPRLDIYRDAPELDFAPITTGHSTYFPAPRVSR